MKKTYLGVGLLTALLIAGFLCAFYLMRKTEPICRDLQQAQQLAFDGAFLQAGDKLLSARQQWQQHKKTIASLTDHAPMEQIDDLFSGAEEYAQLQETEEFALLCGRISRLVEMVSQAQQLYWWNLL